MKKMFIAAALIAAGAGGYWYTQQGASQAANPVLDYIPADTPVFSGLLKPFPLKQYLQSISGQYQPPQDLLIQLDKFDAPTDKFFASIYKQYVNGSQNPEQLLKTFGLADDIQAYFYTLGALPVIKVEVSSIAAFWAVLDKAEQESGFSHEVRQLGDVDYRAYQLSSPIDAKPVELLLAYKEGMLTLTFANGMTDVEVLELALGLKKAPQSLAATGMLQEIIKSHGFMQESVGFINHVEIVKALTSTDGNLLAKQLTALFSPREEEAFSDIRTPECRSELTAVANNWPRTVMGLNAFSVTDKQSHMSASFVLESKKQTILSALQALRGFIPAHLTEINSSIFSMGLGIDVAQLSSSLNTIWEEWQKPAFSCAPLADWQNELSTQNPAMLGMFTGMANGVKGINLSLLDYKMDAKTQELESLDALVSLSAEKPQMLFNMVKPFVPMLADISLADNGEPTDLSALLMLPPELKTKPMLAIKGQNLVIYSGDKGLALAEQLANEQATANGLYRMSADYGKLFTPLFTLLEMSGEPIPAELETFKDYNMRVQMSVDVNSQGLVFGSVMETRN